METEMVRLKRQWGGRNEAEEAVALKMLELVRACPEPHMDFGEEEKAGVLGAARGCWQRNILEEIVEEGDAAYPLGKVLVGHGRGYLGRYRGSYLNLADRLRERGYVLDLKRYGRCGGLWTARVTVVRAGDLAEAGRALA